MFQKANSFLAGVRQNPYFRCKGPMKEAVSEQCLYNDFIPGAPLPPPLCEMILSCPYYSGGEKSRIQRINMQYIFSSCFVGFSTPPPLPNAHHSSEINITSRGCQHTHLVSTMGVIQCDSSPLKNPSYDPEINVFI